VVGFDPTPGEEFLIREKMSLVWIFFGLLEVKDLSNFPARRVFRHAGTDVTDEN
jgi:hypothetical protein